MHYILQTIHPLPITYDFCHVNKCVCFTFTDCTTPSTSCIGTWPPCGSYCLFSCYWLRSSHLNHHCCEEHSCSKLMAFACFMHSLFDFYTNLIFKTFEKCFLIVAIRICYMHHPTNRIVYTTSFVKPVVEH